MKTKRENNPELSIILVNYNAEDYTLNTLNSIYKNTHGINYEVIVVDNSSKDGSLESIKKNFPAVNIINLNYNAGFAKANNEGVKSAIGQFLLILNNDTHVPEGAIKKLLEIKKHHPEYGIVAPVILNPDKSYQLSFGKDLHFFSEIFLKFFANKWYQIYYKLKKGKININVDWVTGACFVINHKLYEQINGFDNNFFIYIEDADFGKRIRQLGYKIHLTSEARIIHYLAQTTKKHPNLILPETKKSHLYYYNKHNSRTALKALKCYLLLKFYLKFFLCFLKSDSEGSITTKKVIKIIREFNYEDYS